MDAGLFDVLHDAADVDLVAVAQRVDVDLDRVLEEAVDQHRVFGRELGGAGDVALQRLVVVDDLHAAPAQHVGRPHQHRIADVGGDPAGLRERGRHAVPRRRQPRRGQQVAERAAVLGQIDGLRRGADDRNPCVGEPLRQPERGLAAELHDDAHHARPAGAGLLLGVEHLQDVLERQRLEVQPVGGVVVGGHRLRVAVDHHGLETRLRQRGCRVHAAVVEFDALADPVGSRTQDQHLGLLGLRRHLGLGGRVELVAAVVVRRLGLELRGAGVHGLVHRVDAEPPPQRAHTVLAGQFRSQRGDLAVRQPLCLHVRSRSASSTAASMTSCRSATSSAICATNHGSMPVASATRSTEAPSRSASSMS